MTHRYKIKPINTVYQFQENSKENSKDISKLHRAVLLLPESQLKTHIIKNTTHRTKKILDPVLKQIVDKDILIYEKVKTMVNLNRYIKNLF